MRAIVAIATDWFRLVRDQKSFRIMAWVTAAFGLLLGAVRFEPERINILFMWNLDAHSFGDQHMPVAFGNLVLYGVLSFYLTTLPFFTFLIAIFATSGIVPDLLRKGRIDTILARPVTRTQFVLGSYAGGLVFVGLIATILSVSSWLGLAVHGRFFSPVWFLTIPVIVAQYAILSSLLLFFGVVLRSGAGAAVLTLLLWLVGKIATDLRSLRFVELAKKTADDEGGEGFLTGAAGPIIDAVYWVMPKGAELGRIYQFVFDEIESGIARSVARHHKVDAVLDAVSWNVVAGTSVALIVVMLALATWILSRRDL